MTSNTNSSENWEKRFAKLWRECEQRGYDTYDPLKDFIRVLLTEANRDAWRAGYLARQEGKSPDSYGDFISPTSLEKK